MRWLLDTTVLIDAARFNDPTFTWLQGALSRPGEVGVCAVSVAEFFAGLRLSERPRWDSVIAELTCWEIACEIAPRAGSYQYDYARRGRTIHTADALIAATALAVGAAVVTANV